MSIPDAYDLFESHDREQERWLASRPVCVFCGEHIQAEHCYTLHEGITCPECLDIHFRKDIDDED